MLHHNRGDDEPSNICLQITSFHDLFPSGLFKVSCFFQHATSTMPFQFRSLIHVQYACNASWHVYVMRTSLSNWKELSQGNHVARRMGTVTTGADAADEIWETDCVWLESTVSQHRHYSRVAITLRILCHPLLLYHLFFPSLATSVSHHNNLQAAWRKGIREFLCLSNHTQKVDYLLGNFNHGFLIKHLVKFHHLILKCSKLQKKKKIVTTLSLMKKNFQGNVPPFSYILR